MKIIIREQLDNCTDSNGKKTFVAGCLCGLIGKAAARLRQDSR